MPRKSARAAVAPDDRFLYESEEPAWDASKHQEAVLSLLPTRARILEVGCGNGIFAKRLAKLGHTVTAIDHSKTGIAFARRNGGGVDFRAGSVYDDLKKKFGLYDCIVAVEVMEHLTEPKKFLEAAYHALRPNGVLVTTTPYHGKIKNTLLALSNRWEGHFNVEEDHLRFFTPHSMAVIREKAGFTDLHFRMIGKLPYLWNSFACSSKKK